MRKQRVTTIAFLTTLLMPLYSAAEEVDYATRDDVRAFAEDLAKTEDFTVDGLLTVFHQARYKQSIIDAISRPAERVLTWDSYQDIFLTQSRISAGQEFMMTHQTALADAYKKYDVPPVVITAIIGVETLYGKHKGNYRVLDSLSTLAFDYPPRSTFFKGELRAFILLVREQNQSIMDLQGSYAGAMGYGQFIPSSYRRYAVDFDGDGVSDIWNNPVDAIGSVANYISSHGWRRGEAVVVPAAIGDADAGLFNVSLKPTSTVAEMQAAGVSIERLLDPKMAVSPMRLAGKNGDEYWLGLHNFYVITRYNHSKLYAMAVFQLSEAIKAAAEVASYSDH